MKNPAPFILCSILIQVGFHISAIAQDYGCDKCSMLKEEYEAAVSPKKEELYEFFKSQCLETETTYMAGEQPVANPEKADKIKVSSKGKCIDYQQVKEIDRKTNKEIASYDINKKDTVFSVAEKVPEFPGGERELVRYLSSNIRYPNVAMQKGIAGTVYLQFVVTSSGDVIRPKLIRSPDESLTAEAMRIVNSMPKWLPGKHNNRDVSVWVTIPVKFSPK